MSRIIPLICAVLLLSLTTAAHAKDPFEGTTWKVSVTPDDDTKGAGERAFDDTLTFKGGKFVSETFKARGFDPVDVDTNSRIGGVGDFTADTKSEKNGKAKWTGTILGSELTGDLVWTKADGTVLNYKFSGEKKQ